jgi:RinA family phage transcriptional activator
LSRVKISVKARQHVRDLLVNYNELKEEMQELRTSIMIPHRESDENIGGGKSSLAVFEVEEKAIKLATNEQISFRAKALAAIDNVLSKSSDEAQQIIELKYFAKDPLSWVAISHKIEGYSEDGCRKIERKIVDRIAEKLGW